MKKSLIWSLFSIVFFAAVRCKNASSEAAAAPIVFEQQKSSWKGCVTPKDTGRCAEVTVDFPFAKGGGKNAVEAINRATEDFCVSAVWLSDSTPPSSLSKAAEAFVQSFRSAVKNEETGPMGWSASITGKPIFQSEKFVSINMESSSYTGGAHGNAGSMVATFDARTGRRLTKSDLLIDTVSILPKLEAAFKKEKGLKPEADIKELIFPDIKFGLPQNLAVVKEGIRFHYNPYEVGPWAIGDTDFVIDWSELGQAASKGKFF